MQLKRIAAVPAGDRADTTVCADTTNQHCLCAACKSIDDDVQYVVSVQPSARTLRTRVRVA